MQAGHLIMQQHRPRTLGRNFLIVNVCNFSGLSEERGLNELARVEHANVGGLLNAFSQRTLDDAASRAQALGVTAILVQLTYGDPAHAIIEAAERQDASPIIVGTRGGGARHRCFWTVCLES